MSVLHRLSDPKSVLYLTDDNDEFSEAVNAAVRHAADVYQEVVGVGVEMNSDRQRAVARLLEIAAELAYHCQIWQLIDHASDDDAPAVEGEHSPSVADGLGTPLTDTLAINTLPLILAKLTDARTACGGLYY